MTYMLKGNLLEGMRVYVPNNLVGAFQFGASAWGMGVQQKRQLVYTLETLNTWSSRSYKFRLPAYMHIFMRFSNF